MATLSDKCIHLFWSFKAAVIKWNSKLNLDFIWANKNQVSGGGDFTLLVDPNDDNGTAYLAYGLLLLHD